MQFKFKTKFYNKLSKLSMTLLLGLCVVSQSYAGGFQLLEADAASTGDFHAGGAADNSSVAGEVYNAAILSTIHKKQLSVGGALITMHSSFTGEVKPLFVTKPASGSTSPINFVPDLHYVNPLNQRWAIGFGIDSLYGLSTKYSGAPIDEVATSTSLKTINFGPSISYLLTKNVSIGAGFDMVHAWADYDNVLGDKELTNSLDGQGYGYHLGVLIMLNPTTNVGLSYRSAIKLKLSGPSTYNDSKTTADADFPLPSLTIISISHEFTHKFAAMFSALYTGWNDFDVLTLENVEPLDGKIVVKQNYKNSWTYSLGAHYWLSQKVMLKLGAAYDQTPTQDGYRDIRLPDANIYYLATGLHFNASKRVGLDFGYAHVFFVKAKIDNSQAGGVLVPKVKGQSESSANVFGAQLTWDIDA